MTRARRLAVVVDGSYLPEPSDMRVLVWEGPRIVWVGPDPAAAPPVDAMSRLPGAWITPGLVDAHVHATATGMARTSGEVVGVTTRAGCVQSR